MNRNFYTSALTALLMMAMCGMAFLSSCGPGNGGRTAYEDSLAALPPLLLSEDSLVSPLPPAQAKVRDIVALINRKFQLSDITREEIGQMIATSEKGQFSDELKYPIMVCKDKSKNFSLSWCEKGYSISPPNYDKKCNVLLLSAPNEIAITIKDSIHFYLVDTTFMQLVDIPLEKRLKAVDPTQFFYRDIPASSIEDMHVVYNIDDGEVLVNLLYEDDESSTPRGDIAKYVKYRNNLKGTWVDDHYEFTRPAKREQFSEKEKLFMSTLVQNNFFTQEEAELLLSGYVVLSKEGESPYYSRQERENYINLSEATFAQTSRELYWSFLPHAETQGLSVLHVNGLGMDGPQSLWHDRIQVFQANDLTKEVELASIMPPPEKYPVWYMFEPLSEEDDTIYLFASFDYGEGDEGGFEDEPNDPPEGVKFPRIYRWDGARFVFDEQLTANYEY